MKAKSPNDSGPYPPVPFGSLRLQKCLPLFSSMVLFVWLAADVSAEESSHTAKTLPVPNIAGDYDANEDFTLTISAQGQKKTISSSAENPDVTIAQQGATFSYTFIVPNASPSSLHAVGRLSGNNIVSLSGPVVGFKQQAGLQVSYNEITKASGTVLDGEIDLDVQGKAGGTLDGVPFSASVSSTIVLTGDVTPIELPADPPTFWPPPTSYASSVTVVLTSDDPTATIYYTIDGSAPSANSTQYTTPITLTSTTTINAIATDPNLNDSSIASATYTIYPAVVLLLHGMNDNWLTWDTFISDGNYFATPPATAPEIFGGKLLRDEDPTPDNFNVIYYRLQFGSFDQSDGVKGLEGITAAGPRNGDFTPIFGPNGLAAEVDEAISLILSLNQGARILLVGHSRGGMAARAFMETPSFKNRAAVVGMLTIGTPHQGTPFGRLYTYLENHPRSGPNATPDWTVVDDVRNPPVNGLDFRIPTIGFMGVGSQSISMLNSQTAHLPRTANYGTLVFDVVPLGSSFSWSSFGANAFYNVFYGGSGSLVGLTLINIPALSKAAAKAITASQSLESYHGDGVSSISEQTFVAANSRVIISKGTPGTLHVNEPQDVSDIRTSMEALVNWWNPITAPTQ